MMDSEIKRGDDGAYRWDYSLNLYNDRYALFLCIKVFLICLSVPWLLLVLGSMGRSGFWMVGFLRLSAGFGILAAVIVALAVAAFIIRAFVMGGSYSIHFEMDEQGVGFEHEKRQRKRVEGREELATLVGGVGRFSGGAISMREELRHTNDYLDFSMVSSVFPHKKRHLIEIYSGSSYNKIYVGEKDFDWVLDFIRKRCPNV